jgi:hypothetical protein
MSVGKIIAASLAVALVLLVGILVGSKYVRRGTEDNSKPVPGDKREVIYNVVILLDLSNRIKKEDQPERDMQAIGMILDIFDEITKNVESKDMLKLAVAPQADFKINCELPSIEMKGISRKVFLDKKKEFANDVSCIYNEAIKKETRGADIYSFFKDHLDKYIRKPDNSRKYENKVIILSDGYLLFDENENRQQGTYMSNADLFKLRNNPDWRRLLRDNDISISADGIDIENTDVLMMEIDPTNSATNETDILHSIWEDWFEHMGIQQPEFIEKEGDVLGSRQQLKTFLTEKKTLKKR